jgi:3-methyladenine DNA glycosylase/8-oxoguanine DNA glycosylase
VTFIELAPIAVRSSFFMHAVGKFEPTAQHADGVFTKCFEHANQVVRFTVREVPAGLDVLAEGPGADDVLARWLTHFPPVDDYAAFAPEHRLVRELHRTRPGLRLVRVPWAYDIGCSVILQQRVRWVDAARQWSIMARQFGMTSPLGQAFPGPRRIARLIPAEIEACGVDYKRATALIRFAREHALNDVVGLDMPLATMRARMLALPGIGPWTTEMIAGFALGDQDAVTVGDLHLPRIVCWALAREPRGDDNRMVQLLEPFAGHRFRVTRLLSSAGISPP